MSISVTTPGHFGTSNWMMQLRYRHMGILNLSTKMVQGAGKTLSAEARKQVREQKIPRRGPPSGNWMTMGGIGALNETRSLPTISSSSILFSRAGTNTSLLLRASKDQ